MAPPRACLDAEPQRRAREEDHRPACLAPRRADARTVRPDAPRQAEHSSGVPGAGLAVRLGRRRLVELAVRPRAPVAVAVAVARRRAERPSVVAEGKQKPAQRRSAPMASASASQRPARVAEAVAAVLRSPALERRAAAPVGTRRRPPERLALLRARSRPPRRPTARS